MSTTPLPSENPQGTPLPIDPLGPPEGMQEFSFKWAWEQEPLPRSQIIYDVSKNVAVTFLAGGAVLALLLPAMMGTCGATRSMKMEWEERKAIIKKVKEEQDQKTNSSENVNSSTSENSNL